MIKTSDGLASALNNLEGEYYKKGFNDGYNACRKEYEEFEKKYKELYLLYQSMLARQGQRGKVKSGTII